VILFLLLLSTGYSLLPTHAAPIAEASAALAKTEERLAKDVATSTEDVRELQQHLATPDQLPQDLQAFERTTTRLKALQQDLTRDIAAYETALVAKLTELDQELAAIHDTTTRDQLQRLRDRVETECQERIWTAQEELASLQTVLAQGADLHHAARAVQLANELTNQGETLIAEVQQVNEQATQYASTTATLLATLLAQTESE